MNRATKNDSWVRNPDGTLGWTSSPITGCLKRCDYCFAMSQANGRLRQRYLANHQWTTCEVPHSIPALLDAFYPRFWMNRIEELDRKLKASKKPLGIFLCIMGELFGDWVPASWQNWVFEIIRRYPEHRFYLLSKQPQNLIKGSPFPDNCYIGVSATDNKELQCGLAHIAGIEAKVKFISFEPLLKRVNDVADGHKDTWILPVQVDWIIIGAMTCGGGDLSRLLALYPELTPMPWEGRWTLQPKISWVQEIVEAADTDSTPVFLKENLLPLFEKEGITKREDWTGLRQELPK